MRRLGVDLSDGGGAVGKNSGKLERSGFYLCRGPVEVVQAIFIAELSQGGIVTAFVGK